MTHAVTSRSEGSSHSHPRVAYLLKVYPRFSQTFVLNEILAHQADGKPVEIFSLRRPNDGKFHRALSLVKTSVQYFDELPRDAASFLRLAQESAGELTGLWKTLKQETNSTADELYQAIKVALAIRARGIQHIHAHFGNTATAVARLAAAMAGVSYSFTAHARDIFHDNVRDEDLRRKLNDAAGVVTVSQFNVEFLRNKFAGAADHVRLIYNGLDLDSFPFSPATDMGVRIVAVGRLVEKKGLCDLVTACGLLVRNGVSNLSCQIVGGGPLQNELQAQIIDERLERHVELLRALPLDEVKTLIRKATLLAAPCVVAENGDRDGLPTVLLEAMALGTPCIATQVTGIPEAIKHEQTGLIVPPGDPTELAKACLRLTDNPALCDQLASNARQLIESKFDISKNAQVLRQSFVEWTRENTRAREQVA